MPTCNECNTHWFNWNIERCPVCDLPIARVRALPLMNNLDPCNISQMAKMLNSFDMAECIAAANTLGKAQSRPAFDVLLSVASSGVRSNRYDDNFYVTLKCLSYYPQYIDEFLPLLLYLVAEKHKYRKPMASDVISLLQYEALKYLLKHKSDIADPVLFWETITDTLSSPFDNVPVEFIQLISSELVTGKIPANALLYFMKFIGKQWFPIDNFIDYSRSILQSVETREERIERKPRRISLAISVIRLLLLIFFELPLTLLGSLLIFIPKFGFEISSPVFRLSDLIDNLVDGSSSRDGSFY